MDRVSFYPDGTADVLAATENRSELIRESIERRRRDYEEARAHLNLQKNELQAIVEAVADVTPTYDAPLGEQLGEAMKAYDATEWGIKGTDWGLLRREVETSEPAARALWTVAREYHSCWEVEL